ncbi:hypothetical protein DSC91_006884 [Paraburkholderia caffeinilytica]|uniref:Ornithine cyclodeaminase n=1 Tax=Paraburkholderia caffeinilytica TaxID=1761016 RepID=A0ABQ1LTC2_9BURK|nr:ornithine cyclodeaminase family protein [Paraburkholderia caffeinilytica]AXL53456.1 hypothetical protein DSC91_006884 [Paraburkholderia caffeinilytica]GGC29402.1 ornithine cyclodeaminase [Paraburkholderia caffeinilytica]CAB3781393.1 Delta(1)-pyrroline-2-carboxylate reductase [Paraburkholderia caffeinilytica]
MLQPTAAELAALLPFERLVPALAQAFEAGAQVPLRHSHTIQTGDDTGTSLLMPAWDAEGFYGVKIVNIFPGNRNKGLKGLHSTYLLYDGRTGVPLAMLDGDVITSRRTAAAAALGVSLLAKASARSLLVCGAGQVGSLVGPAIASVRALDRIAVWNVNADAARRCAARWRDEGLPAEAVTDLESAVRNADIVSCATLATEPLIHAEWLEEGSHLDLIGSFTPQMVEAAAGCFQQGDVWVDTQEALLKAGDLLKAISAGVWSADAVKGNLTELCRNVCQRRTNDRQRTVFKAVGSALEDLAAARLAYRFLAGQRAT